MSRVDIARDEFRRNVHVFASSDEEWGDATSRIHALAFELQTSVEGELALRSLTEDSEPLVRAFAAEYLLPDPHAVSVLREVVRSGDAVAAAHARMALGTRGVCD